MRLGTKRKKRGEYNSLKKAVYRTGEKQDLSHRTTHLAGRSRHTADGSRLVLHTKS